MSQVSYSAEGQTFTFGGFFNIDDQGNLIILSDATHSGHPVGAVAAGKWDWVQVHDLGSP